MWGGSSAKSQQMQSEYLALPGDFLPMQPNHGNNPWIAIEWGTLMVLMLCCLRVSARVFDYPPTRDGLSTPEAADQSGRSEVLKSLGFHDSDCCLETNNR